MGLLTKYGAINRTVSTALDVKYLQTSNTRTINYKDSSGESKDFVLNFVEVTRIATKRYSYEGMDYATAISCRDAKKAKYTRGRKVPGWYVWDPIKQKLVKKQIDACQADITAEHVSGGMWRVVVNVNESDSVTVDGTMPTDLSTLFADLDLSDYDEEET